MTIKLILVLAILAPIVAFWLWRALTVASRADDHMYRDLVNVDDVFIGGIN